MIERLQKILASAGVASRRAAEALILEGRVTVNGRVVRILGSKADPGDDIRVDGRPLAIQATKRYLMIHKPAGYVTTLKDPQARPTVVDLLPDMSERLFPVGRLDYDSEGLLLMTNDGDLAYRLQHPRFGMPKTYRVRVEGHLTPSDLESLRAGFALSDGPFKPLEAGLEKQTINGAWLWVTIAEGRNRILRRAFEHLGFPVRRLIRVAVGGVRLGTLKRGEYRDLTPSELETLRIFLKKLS